MRLLKILLFIAFLPICGFGQNFAYLIEDFADYNDKTSVKVHEDAFYFVNKRLENSFMYSFNNAGDLNWRKDIYEEYQLNISSRILIENDSLLLLTGLSDCVPMHPESGSIGSLDNFLPFHNRAYYIAKVDSFYFTGTRDFWGSGTATQSSYTLCSYLGRDELRFCNIIGENDFHSTSVNTITHDGNGNVYYVVNGDGFGSSTNSLYKVDLDENTTSSFLTSLFVGNYTITSKIIATKEYLVVSHFNHDLSECFDFSYYDFDGQLLNDIDYHNPNGCPGHMIGCENNDVVIVGSGNDFSRYSNTGELIWAHELSFYLDGNPVQVWLNGVEELSNGKLLLYGQLDGSIVVFTLDSDGCFSDEDCDVIEIGECIACDLITFEFDPKDLEVQCDNDGDYLLEIFNWINYGGMVGFFSDIDDLSIDYTWSGSYEVGTHEVTFNFEIPSMNFQESYVVELVIEPNKDSPKIISDPEPLTILEAEFLYESVQEWLDQSGNMEVKHNCGTYELSHDFSYEYYQGFHLVEFTATADNGKKSTRTATLHIAGDWISQVDETHSVEIILAPNPVEDILNISGVINQSSWKIYSLIGEDVLFGDSSESELSINVSHLPDGVYYIELSKTFNNQKVVKRFLKF